MGSIFKTGPQLPKGGLENRANECSIHPCTRFARLTLGLPRAAILWVVTIGLHDVLDFLNTGWTCLDLGPIDFIVVNIILISKIYVL